MKTLLKSLSIFTALLFVSVSVVYADDPTPTPEPTPTPHPDAEQIAEAVWAEYDGTPIVVVQDAESLVSVSEYYVLTFGMMIVLYLLFRLADKRLWLLIYTALALGAGWLVRSWGHFEIVVALYLMGVTIVGVYDALFSIGE